MSRNFGPGGSGSEASTPGGRPGRRRRDRARRDRRGGHVAVPPVHPAPRRRPPGAQRAGAPPLRLGRVRRRGPRPRRAQRRGRRLLRSGKRNEDRSRVVPRIGPPAGCPGLAALVTMIPETRAPLQWRLPPVAVLLTAVVLIGCAEVGGASMVRFKVELTRWARHA